MIKKNNFSNSNYTHEEDVSFMTEALEEAKKALESEDWPVGCVIVLDKKIIGRGRNQVYSKKNKTAHAEIMALNSCAEILSERGREATMYVTYEPCPMCLGATLLNHIGRIVTGPDLDKSGGLSMIDSFPERFKNDKYKFELVKEILKNECQTMFLKGKPTNKIRSMLKLV
jgi:tRNA(adenine34) deaminase